MTTSRRAAVVLASALAVSTVGIVRGGRIAAVPGAEPAAVTPTQFDAWVKQHSNWGRWGKTDELGAVNLITPAKRKQAAALVKEGVTVSLSELQGS